MRRNALHKISNNFYLIVINVNTDSCNFSAGLLCSIYNPSNF